MDVAEFEKAMGVLRTKGAVVAEFHENGNIKSVQFGPPDATVSTDEVRDGMRPRDPFKDIIDAEPPQLTLEAGDIPSEPATLDDAGPEAADAGLSAVEAASRGSEGA